jgi:hypothetical protein
MSLQADLKLRPDPTFDAKWSDLDLLRIFQPDELSNLWNELVRTGELVSTKSIKGIFKQSYFQMESYLYWPWAFKYSDDTSLNSKLP